MSESAHQLSIAAIVQTPERTARTGASSVLARVRNMHESQGRTSPGPERRGHPALLTLITTRGRALSGSVWGSDEHRAAGVAERLECGTAWVNTHLVNAPYQPFGGRKWTGVGVENGRWGMEMFTEPQVLHRARPRARP